MAKNQWINNCPACGELLHQFHLKKSFNPGSASDGWSGVESFYCPACDSALVVVGFSKEDRSTFTISRDGDGSFSFPQQPPGSRMHPCYSASMINSAAAMWAPRF